MEGRLISNKKKGNSFSLILVIITISLQFFLGILTLINNVPIFFASLHQTNSVLLLASMLFAYHRHRYKKNNIMVRKNIINRILKIKET